MKLGVASSDLTRMLALQRLGASTRRNLDVAGQEATTGQKSDLFAASSGNLTKLFSLERALERTAVYKTNVETSAMRLEITQEALGRIFAPVESLSVELLTAVGLGDMTSGMLHADEARRRFGETIATLNTRVAGQALFAGTATGQPALASSDAILAELDTLAQGAVTASDAIAAIDAYFAKPGGAFFTNGYLGSTTDLTPVEIAEGSRLQVGVRADNDAIVSALRAQALAAVVSGGAFEGDADSQKQILGAAGNAMIGAKNDVLRLRASVGVSQSAMESAKAERESERSMYDMARADILSADQAEAASRFKNLEAQLEAIYTITARLSNLRFTNYMR
jgi:flagellar hook-associated protein 3 FlgL